MIKNKNLVFLLIAIFTLVLTACGGAAAPAAEIDIQALPANVNVQTVYEIMDNPDVYLLDVRELWEYNEGHIPDITLLPLGELPASLSNIPTDKEVIITCRSGNRSQQAVNFLMQQGFDNVHNMDGGILAWESAGLPVDR